MNDTEIVEHVESALVALKSAFEAVNASDLQSQIMATMIFIAAVSFALEQRSN